MTANLIRKGPKLKKKLKTQGKNSKLKEKTQNSRKKLKTQVKNSRKKLRVWEALAPYVSPSGVKKNACTLSSEAESSTILVFRTIIDVKSLQRT